MVQSPLRLVRNAHRILAKLYFILFCLLSSYIQKIMSSENYYLLSENYVFRSLLLTFRKLCVQKITSYILENICTMPRNISEENYENNNNDTFAVKALGQRPAIPYIFHCRLRGRAISYIFYCLLTFRNVCFQKNTSYFQKIIFLLRKRKL